MTMQSLVVALMWLLPLVAADYSCSRNSTVIDFFMFDFLRNFQQTGIAIRQKTWGEPDHTMNITNASKYTHRNITMSAECGSNTTSLALCVSCLGIIITNIYEVCCQQRSSWGNINLRSDCTLAYDAPDYVEQGWTDPYDDSFPKQVEEDPGPLDLDAAPATIAITSPHHLYFISFPTLLLTSFIAMYP